MCGTLCVAIPDVFFLVCFCFYICILSGLFSYVQRNRSRTPLLCGECLLQDGFVYLTAYREVGG